MIRRQMMGLCCNMKIDNNSDDEDRKYLAMDEDGDWGRYHTRADAIAWIESNKVEGEIFKLCAKVTSKTTFKVTGVK